MKRVELKAAKELKRAVIEDIRKSCNRLPRSSQAGQKIDYSQASGDPRSIK